MIPQGIQRSRCQETILLFIFLIKEITECQLIDAPLLFLIFLNIRNNTIISNNRNNNEDTLYLHNTSNFSK